MGAHPDAGGAIYKRERARSRDLRRCRGRIRRCRTGGGRSARVPHNARQSRGGANVDLGRPKGDACVALPALFPYTVRAAGDNGRHTCRPTERARQRGVSEFQNSTVCTSIGFPRRTRERTSRPTISRKTVSRSRGTRFDQAARCFRRARRPGSDSRPGRASCRPRPSQRTPRCDTAQHRARPGRILRCALPDQRRPRRVSTQQEGLHRGVRREASMMLASAAARHAESSSRPPTAPTTPRRGRRGLVASCRSGPSRAVRPSAA